MKQYLRAFIIITYIFFILLIYLPVYEEVSFSFYSCQEINCSQVLVELLEIYPENKCAFYDLKDETIWPLISEGVLFEENYNLKNSSLKSVSSKGLMHNKYCVFNEQYVLTGSWNPTPRGTNLNDNYILFIDSKTIAKKFIEEYEHLKDRSRIVSPQKISYDSGDVEIYFCPQHDCQEQIIRTLSQAQKSVYLLAFTFTDQDIAEKLLELSRNKIYVEIIFEKTRITRYSSFYALINSSVQIYLDGNRYTMHGKMFIIDEETVILGSYNPTKAATQKNDENILIIKDATLVKTVLKEYMRVQSLAIR